MIDSTRSSVLKDGGGIGYMPGLGVMKSDIPINSWTYREGKWNRNEALIMAKMRKTYHYLAIELTLNKY